MPELARERKVQRFGKKARIYARRKPAEDARINILIGAVRSGKTWANIPKILWLCRYEVEGHKVITGVSKQSIYQNILNDLFEVAGKENYSYNRQTGELILFGCKWLVIGAKDEGSERYLRGITIGVVVSDELVLMPENFWLMLLSRMSPRGARLYATTNPDSPYHWVKAQVLDNDRLIYGLGKDIWYETWTMEDNPSLEDEYKESLKRSHVGVFYERFILGKWVMAKGAVYKDVLTDDIFYEDETRPGALLSQGGHTERWIAVDVGTINAFAALDIYDDGRTLWCERELYWDSVKESRQKTNTEYANDLVQFFGTDNQLRWPGVIIDPSAASFRAELISRRVYVIDADNEVDEGIRKVSAMLGNKKIRIHKRCVNTIREMQTYAWDTKKAENGKEQPIKAHDHTVDSLRYLVNTRINDYRLAAA